MKKRTVLYSVIGCSSVLVLGSIWIASRTHHHAPAKVALKVVDPLANVPTPKAADHDYTANPKAAVSEYKAYVARYETTPDPVIQDQVGVARVKLGYLAAHQRDWEGARKEFLQADAKTKGTGSTGDFGSVNEQGAYEAIVCLEASGKKDEARQQFTAFIQKRPLSALCMACYRRLKGLNSGKTTPELDALIDKATKKQDANAHFEASVCGPKTIAYLCETGAIQAGSHPHDYKAIARLCHTTDHGTTMAGMLDGLKALGCRPAAFRIDRQDLKKIKGPAILLWGEHYISLLEVQDRAVRVYDTLTHCERTLSLPVDSDPDFYINTILLNGAL